MDIWNPEGFFRHFPRLATGAFQVTSPATPTYNCVAWAAEDVHRWWWPAPDSYWPPGAPAEETLHAFRAAFETLGFEVTASHEPEEGLTKVALLADNGAPTHAARQLANGRWTSKCGQNIDLEHALFDVEGPLYGTVALILRRPSTTALG